MSVLHSPEIFNIFVAQWVNAITVEREKILFQDTFPAVKCWVIYVTSLESVHVNIMNLI